ncbi:hypothetical protein ACCO45_012900 [Purpureocillium lilacinum]|uniref:Uncharacterized protein n=1 Tax=Purpureocillium lilacinum TaxID=33203 RepID=A0ACC4D999_PURLI
MHLSRLRIPNNAKSRPRPPSSHRCSSTKDRPHFHHSLGGNRHANHASHPAPHPARATWLLAASMNRRGPGEMLWRAAPSSQLQVRQQRLAGLAALEVRGRALVKALPDEGSLAEEQLNVLFRPGLGGQALQEHHDLLKVHLDELVGPLDEQGGAHVEVELGEALLLGLGEGGKIDGVPHADGVLDADLSHQQAVHPAEAKLDKLHALLLQVLGQRRVDARREVAQGAHLALYPRLRHDVVVLDSVEELGEAPEGVGLDRIEHRLGQLARVHARLDVVVRNVQAQKHLPERRHQIVDALHVSACRVSHGPDVQDALQRSLRRLVAVELDMRVRPGHVDADLVPDCLVQPSCAAGARRVRSASFERLSDAIHVLLALPLQRRDPPLAVRREVAEEQLPRHGADLLGNPPDHASERRSGSEIADACSSFLNLLMRVIRELIASASLADALDGTEG